MSPRVIVSVVLLLVATSVLFTRFTATAATSVATYCYWDPTTNQNVCVSGPGQWYTTSYPYYPRYPYHHYYSGYGYYPGYGYEVETTTETVTATSYSTVTQTSEVTLTTTSIPEPLTVTTSATLTTTATTRDTTAEMLYGSLMAVFLALFLATLVLLVGSRSRGSKGSNPQSSQAAIAAPAVAHIATSHKCSACGTEVDPNTKFCGNCGAQLRAK